MIQISIEDDDQNEESHEGENDDDFIEYSRGEEDTELEIKKKF